jgi:hypothetical protein
MIKKTFLCQAIVLFLLITATSQIWASQSLVNRIDLNGDERSDLVFCEDQWLYIALQDLTGDLYISSSIRAKSYLMLDCDRDGDPDLWVEQDNGNVICWQNNGRGAFSLPGSTPVWSDLSHAINLQISLLPDDRVLSSAGRRLQSAFDIESRLENPSLSLFPVFLFFVAVIRPPPLVRFPS